MDHKKNHLFLSTVRPMTNEQTTRVIKNSIDIYKVLLTDNVLVLFIEFFN